jgi:hypothetical protein
VRPSIHVRQHSCAPAFMRASIHARQLVGSVVDISCGRRCSAWKCVCVDRSCASKLASSRAPVWAHHGGHPASLDTHTRTCTCIILRPHTQLSTSPCSLSTSHNGPTVMAAEAAEERRLELTLGELCKTLVSVCTSGTLCTTLPVCSRSRPRSRSLALALALALSRSLSLWTRGVRVRGREGADRVLVWRDSRSGLGFPILALPYAACAHLYGVLE